MSKPFFQLLKNALQGFDLSGEISQAVHEVTRPEAAPEAIDRPLTPSTSSGNETHPGGDTGNKPDENVETPSARSTSSARCGATSDQGPVAAAQAGRLQSAGGQRSATKVASVVQGKPPPQSVVGVTTGVIVMVVLPSI